MDIKKISRLEDIRELQVDTSIIINVKIPTSYGMIPCQNIGILFSKGEENLELIGPILTNSGWQIGRIKYSYDKLNKTFISGEMDFPLEENTLKYNSYKQRLEQII